MTDKNDYKITGILGWPVSHSLSPLIHNFWIKQYNRRGAYIPLEISPNDLKSAIDACYSLGMAGLNLTLPHKESCLSVLDKIDETALEIGAVNTIVFQTNGKTFGYNTDSFGFRAAIESKTPNGWNLSGKNVVVIGSGGASKAVLHAIRNWGAGEIRITNRTDSRAENLAIQLGSSCKFWPWNDRNKALADVSLLVNTTSCGMQGQPPLDLDLDRLPKSAVVNDIVYTPLMTTLLKRAKARGNPIISGLEMLFHQARPGFKMWFNIEPQITNDLRKIINAALVMS
ncbi:MAG: shikimate dehydrogenase [Pseudomonadota bacterium]|nr:shikimate dehydrogenase [Pseudomonadota bacterium]